MSNNKPISEKYPNLRSEQKDVRIKQMIPAPGWWRLTVDADGTSWIEPIAFFCTVTYKSRHIWDGGQNDWEEHECLHAHSGTGMEWYLDGYFAYDSCAMNQRLFYDPDFRLSREKQLATIEDIEPYLKK